MLLDRACTTGLGDRPKSSGGGCHGPHGRQGRIRDRCGTGQGRSHAVRLAREGADIIAVDICQTFHTPPIPWVTAQDISNAVLFLASDEARYIKGVALPVDAGCCLK